MSFIKTLEHKASPVRTMQTYVWSRDMAPLISNLDTTVKHCEHKNLVQTALRILRNIHERWLKHTHKTTPKKR